MKKKQMWGKLERCMIQPSVCGDSEKKNEKYGHVNKLLKSTSVYKRKKEKKRKRKIIDTTKI